MQLLSHHLWIGFIGGLLAFAHCLGMCSGFVVHLARESDRRRVMHLHLLWHAGRITMYIFMGAIVGYTGGLIQKVMFDFNRLQNVLGFITGIFILVMGINLLGLLPAKMKRSSLTGGLLGDLCSTLKNSPSMGATFFLGMLTGCLPCPVLLAFLAYALQTGSVLSGMATMAAVGCGTTLPLLLVGIAGRWVHLWNWGSRAGGLILILLGISTILRGTGFYHSLLGCSPSVPVHVQSLSNRHECPHPTQVKDVRH